MPTTLIIDDEVEICQLLSSYLKKKGCKVEYALTLEDGLLKCKSIKPDLIFLDNNLPDGSGISAIPIFNKLIPDGNIIIISSMSNLLTNAIAAGAMAFISKPISFRNIDKHI